MNLKCKITIKNNEKDELQSGQLYKKNDLIIVKCEKFELTFDRKIKRIIKKEYNNSFIRIDIENENMLIKEKEIELELKIKVIKFIEENNKIILEYMIDKEKIIIEIKY